MALLQFSVVVAIALAPLGATAQTFALLSHRAVYDLSLARAEQGSGITGVRGRLVMEWTDVCEGYTLNQRIFSEVRQEDAAVQTDFNVSTWESKDGHRFRFASRHSENDNVVEEVRGRAALGRADEGGTATFELPAEGAVRLPGGTLFPTAHTALLLRRAEEGARQVQAHVFDGSGLDGLQEASAFIGKSLDGSDYKGVGAKLLGPLPSWRMRIAYFTQSDAGSAPQYEVSFRLFRNGVATDIVLDYGDFALKGALRQLEALDGAC